MLNLTHDKREGPDLCVLETPPAQSSVRIVKFSILQAGEPLVHCDKIDTRNSQSDQSMRPLCNRSFGQYLGSQVALPAAQYLRMAQRPITAFLKRSADESCALAQRKTAKKAGSTVLNLPPWHNLQTVLARVTQQRIREQP